MRSERKEEQYAMSKVQAYIVTNLRHLLKEYEEEVKLSGYADEWKPTKVREAKYFIDWLADEYSPLDFGSLAR